MATVRGGDKIRERVERLAKNSDLRLRAGFLENATYPDGTPVAMAAATSEFGAAAIGVPPRPFFRNMIAAKKNEWPEALGDLLLSNDFDVQKSLTILGEGIAGQLRQSIIDTNQPPLSPVTLMLRKMKAENPNLVVSRRVVAQARQRVASGESVAGVSTKPLVDTGHLLGSVDSEVG